MTHSTPLISRHTSDVTHHQQVSCRFMFDVGASFSNPAKAIVPLLLSVPGASACCDRRSIELQLADILHSHISSVAADAPGDKQNQQKMAKALEVLKPKDGVESLSFDGINWHRLLVRNPAFKTHIHETHNIWSINLNKLLMYRQSYLAMSLSAPIFLWIPRREQSGGSNSEQSGDKITFAPYFYSPKKSETYSFPVTKTTSLAPQTTKCSSEYSSPSKLGTHSRRVDVLLYTWSWSKRGEICTSQREF